MYLTLFTFSRRTHLLAMNRPARSDRCKLLAQAELALSFSKTFWFHPVFFVFEFESTQVSQ